MEIHAFYFVVSLNLICHVSIPAWKKKSQSHLEPQAKMKVFQIFLNVLLHFPPIINRNKPLGKSAHSDKHL